MIKHPPRSAQRGYLYEVPILILVLLLVLSVLLPALPPLGRKILIFLVASGVTLGLYYMIVIPGWMPGDRSRLRPPWNWLVFIIVAPLIMGAAIAMIYGMKD